MWSVQELRPQLRPKIEGAGFKVGEVKEVEDDSVVQKVGHQDLESYSWNHTKRRIKH